MNADLSVAPEIAQLAAPFVLPPQSRESTVPHTVGRMAGLLSELAAAPQRWWDLVRFDPDGPARIPVPGEPGVWLLVLPPGMSVDCDCQQATALAGEAAEAAGDPANGGHRPLRPGRVRVHGAGGRHRLHAAGPGYSVTLHVGASSPRSE